MLKGALPLALLIGCSEYDIKALPGEETGLSDSAQMDSGDTAEPDTTVETADTGDTAQEETGDTGPTLPTYPIWEAIDACLSLRSGACPVNIEEGATDSDCLAAQAVETALIESELVMAAQEATGDTTITLADIENGYVRGTVWAYSSLERFEHEDESYTQKMAFLHISFGDNSAAYADIFTPYDVLPMTSLRCGMYAYSHDMVSDIEDVVTATRNTENMIKRANENPATGILNIRDYREDGLGVYVHNINYEPSDPNFVLDPSYITNENVGDEIYRVAAAYTGGGSGTDSVVQVY